MKFPESNKHNNLVWDISASLLADVKVTYMSAGNQIPPIPQTLYVEMIFVTWKKKKKKLFLKYQDLRRDIEKNMYIISHINIIHIPPLVDKSELAGRRTLSND